MELFLIISLMGAFTLGKICYPVAIEPGDEKLAFGVVIPDLPGCFSAGDTLEEAYANAKQAAELWMETQIAEGAILPVPSTLGAVAKKPEFKEWHIGYIEIDVPII